MGISLSSSATIEKAEEEKQEGRASSSSKVIKARGASGGVTEANCEERLLRGSDSSAGAAIKVNEIGSPVPFAPARCAGFMSRARKAASPGDKNSPLGHCRRGALRSSRRLSGSRRPVLRAVSQTPESLTLLSLTRHGCVRTRLLLVKKHSLSEHLRFNSRRYFDGSRS